MKPNIHLSTGSEHNGFVFIIFQTEGRKIRKIKSLVQKLWKWKLYFTLQIFNIVVWYMTYVKSFKYFSRSQLKSRSRSPLNTNFLICYTTCMSYTTVWTQHIPPNRGLCCYSAVHTCYYNDRIITFDSHIPLVSLSWTPKLFFFCHPQLLWGWGWVSGETSQPAWEQRDLNKGD